MRLKKRVMALAMASVMAAALAGCGSSAKETQAPKETEAAQETKAESTSDTEKADGAEAEDTEQAQEKEPVNLVWWYRGNGEQKDTKMVQDALNEQLKTYPGLEHVTVELKCYTASEYKQAVTLAQSSDEQIDILNTVNLDFAEEVEKGSLIDPMGRMVHRVKISPSVDHPRSADADILFLISINQSLSPHMPHSIGKTGFIIGIVFDRIAAQKGRAVFQPECHAIFQTKGSAHIHTWPQHHPSSA